MADQPKRPGKPPERAKRPADDEEEAPRSKKKSRPVEDEDDEDDYDDAPRPKKRKGGVEKIIPYKNGMALGAYYCGVFSLIPIVGFALGPVAVVLGIIGFIKAGKNPNAGGKGHAIAGIILGVLGVIVWPIAAFALGYYNK